ncbi:hypothetical protein C9374_003639 [Naegleria lovaniensis]|nr:uncharacterized protein C9374_003639 [Naegleria lovaniensis]KAG2393875.1 hypothetical protein C9374_003639 [Naegleria lovaniensis]
MDSYELWKEHLLLLENSIYQEQTALEQSNTVPHHQAASTKEPTSIFKNRDFESISSDYSNNDCTKSLVTFKVFKKQYIYRKARRLKHLFNSDKKPAEDDILKQTAHEEVFRLVKHDLIKYIIENRSFKLFDHAFSTDPIPFLIRFHSFDPYMTKLDDVYRLMYGSNTIPDLKQRSKFYWAWKNHQKNLTSEKVRIAMQAIGHQYMKSTGEKLLVVCYYQVPFSQSLNTNNEKEYLTADELVAKSELTVDRFLEVFVEACCTSRKKHYFWHGPISLTSEQDVFSQFKSVVNGKKKAAL